MEIIIIRYDAEIALKKDTCQNSATKKMTKWNARGRGMM